MRVHMLARATCSERGVAPSRDQKTGWSRLGKGKCSSQHGEATCRRHRQRQSTIEKTPIAVSARMQFVDQHRRAHAGGVQRHPLSRAQQSHDAAQDGVPGDEGRRRRDTKKRGEARDVESREANVQRCEKVRKERQGAVLRHREAALDIVRIGRHTLVLGKRMRGEQQTTMYKTAKTALRPCQTFRPRKGTGSLSKTPDYDVMVL